MNEDHERYAEWDAAYVLGALTPADRRAYEAHLEACERCRAAVAELAPMPGLLARLDAEAAAAAGVTDAAPASGLESPGPATATGRPDAAPGDVPVVDLHPRDRRRRVRVLAAAAAAVLLVAAVVAGIVTAVLPGGAAETVAMHPVGDTPLSATVTVADVPWGTRLSITCRYGTGEWTGEGETWEYGLYVTDTRGEETQVSTWHAGQGQVVRLDAGTALERTDLVSIEVRALGTGDPQLEVEVP